MLEVIRVYLMRRMNAMRIYMTKWNRLFYPIFIRFWRKIRLKQLLPYLLELVDFSLKSIYMHGSRHVVDLANQTCKCKIWDLTSIPCRHAMETIFDRDLEIENFVHLCYHVAAYKRAYEHFLNPMDGVDMRL